MEHKPKIPLVSAILITFLLIIVEIISAIFLVVGPWIADVIISPVLAWYIQKKGLSLTRYLVTAGLEIIPGVNELPLLTIGFLLTVWIDRHPKIAAVAEKAEALKEGKIGELVEGEPISGKPSEEEAAFALQAQEEQRLEEEAEEEGVEEEGGLKQEEAEEQEEEIQEALGLRESLGKVTEFEAIRESMEEMPEPEIVGRRKTPSPRNAIIKEGNTINLREKDLGEFDKAA